MDPIIKTGTFQWRKANHLCVECAMDLTQGEINRRMIRCKHCRQKNTEAQREYQKEYQRLYRELQLTKPTDAKISSALAAWQKQYDRCMNCEFSRTHDNVLFCPSAAGTCLKEELNHENPDPVSSCNTDDADISGVHLGGEG